MPLVLRIAGLVTDQGAAGDIIPVPLWVSSCLAQTTTAGEVIDYFLAVAAERQDGLFGPYLGDTLAAKKPRRGIWETIISPLRRKKNPTDDEESPTRATTTVEWCLCIRDADGVYHFCGDSNHYRKSRLINIPFLAGTATQSHVEFEEMKRQLALKHSGPTARDERPVDEINTLSVPVPWLASPSAALLFADKHEMKFAFATCAVIAAPTLQGLNASASKGKRGLIKKARVAALYDAVTVPPQLLQDPMTQAEAAETPAGAAEIVAALAPTQSPAVHSGTADAVSSLSSSDADQDMLPALPLKETVSVSPTLFAGHDESPSSDDASSTSSDGGDARRAPMVSPFAPKAVSPGPAVQDDRRLVAARARHQAALENLSALSSSPPHGDTATPVTRQLAQRREELRREIADGEAASRECDKLESFIEFYKSELVECNLRVQQLRSAIPQSS